MLTGSKSAAILLGLLSANTLPKIEEVVKGVSKYCELENSNFLGNITSISAVSARNFRLETDPEK